MFKTLTSQGFTATYNEIMEDTNLTPTERLTYFNITKFCFNGKNYCFPSIKAIAKLVGRSTRTISRCIKKLVKLGYLKVERKLGFVNTYTVLKPYIDKAVTQVKETVTKVKKSWKNNKKNKSNFNNFDQRTYDMDELEKKLLGWT